MIAKGQSPTFRGALPVRVDRDDLLAALKDLVLYLHDDDLNGPVIGELRDYAIFNQIDAKARALIARLEP